MAKEAPTWGDARIWTKPANGRSQISDAARLNEKFNPKEMSYAFIGNLQRFAKYFGIDFDSLSDSQLQEIAQRIRVNSVNAAKNELQQEICIGEEKLEFCDDLED